MKVVTPESLRMYRRSSSELDKEILARVAEIIDEVRERGDDALMDFSREFDRVEGDFQMEVTDEEFDEAQAQVRAEHGDILRYFLNAADNIRRYHERQRESSWMFTENGNLFGQIITPVDRAGVYVPGGKAFYPSSVLMNIIPAKAAGVPEIVISTPPSREGTANPMVLTLARELGADKVFKLGGAHAIAALAYGTQTVPQVAKITGPGNIYVATAKRLVSGVVGIDSIAGPSEVVVLADHSADPELAAIDLCAQAEHDENNAVFLISPSRNFIDQVNRCLDKIIPTLERRHIIETSLDLHSFAVAVDDLDQAFDIVNRIAPEHIEVMMDMDSTEIFTRIRNAGAIFIGNFSPVASGDYYCGPNHILPTSGAARFSSPLGVYDFMKRSSFLSVSEGYLKEKGEEIEQMALFEGFDAHALSVRMRLDGTREG
ncbi:MAG: histidinol dehydrogenase [Brevinematales bacterium]|nr:histidinol dehydrogenase [Brevinematales bacterium]